MKSLLQNIGDYQILAKLGRGGMADVYLALDVKNNRRVALKLIERGEGPEAQEIIEAERLGAELQQRISQTDPRVPEIHAFGDLEGYFFIEMELVEGKDLSELIASGPMKPDDASRIALELCSILRNAHGLSLQVDGRDLRAVVHGDIKPKNIRIDSTERVRVLDFGIAKGLSITRRLTNNVFGSVAYSSPERLETGSIDEKSDLWSVGVVLYEMIEQRLPFEAVSTERLETIIRSRNAIQPLKDSCPPALQQVIYKALACSPASRYQDAAQFESDLNAFLTGVTTLAAQENERTRRTAPIEEVETQRTTFEPVPGPAPVSPFESFVDSLYRKSRNYLVRLKKWILAGGLVLLVSLGTWEGVVMRSAARLKPDFIQNSLEGDDAWSRYQAIRKQSLLGFAPLMLRDSLTELLVASCERVFNEYRSSDNPRVREGDWVRCRRYMSHAVLLDSGDRKFEAFLEYANGHIFRINRKSLDAIAAFQRAASLQPRWPDPYLGMARTYIYSLGDMDRGTQALESARQLGFNFGKRELAMMAEAHRQRALQDLENAKLVTGTDQETEFLKKAESDFDAALQTYLQITPWGDSTTQILGIQDLLGEVRQRLNAINKPNPLLPWNWFK